MNEPYILFKINRTDYAVASESVQQLQLVENITFVPNAPEFVEGVVYLRGKVVPVVNLRKRFKMDPIPFDLNSRMIVIQLEGRVVALIVDSAREFIQIDPENIIPPPDSLSTPALNYLSGITSMGDRLVLIVDLPKLFGIQEREVLAQL
jgi:purine-binding chemotaxis protein CheW